MIIASFIARGVWRRMLPRSIGSVVANAADATAWITVASAITSTGAATHYTAAVPAKHFRVMLSALAVCDNHAVVGTPVGNRATVDLDAPVRTR